MTTDHPTPAPMDGERVEELAEVRYLIENVPRLRFALAAGSNIEAAKNLLAHTVTVLKSLAASLSEAETRAERAEKERDALGTGPGSMLSVPEYAYRRHMEGHHKNRNYPFAHCDACYREDAVWEEGLEAERSRSSRVIEAAKKVRDDYARGIIAKANGVTSLEDLCYALANEPIAQDTPTQTTSEEGAEDG